MKSLPIRHSGLTFKHYLNITSNIFEELLFINLFFLGPKGCKLLKTNSSFRIRGKRRNFFLHPLLYR